MRFFTVLSILSIGLVAATPLAGPEAAAVAQSGQSCGSCCIQGQTLKKCCAGAGCNYCAGTGGEIC
ncbi:hypothetical protein PTTW11_08422 [Pyrenophora teres f. teres]|uniref:Uncharacterized protein n=1 Tax=Pyrenophora teres f. teres TaxID=97479 RepID=A0A6S6W906_9PLEO|nr:hypothetical protein PTTW11_08422 [Pyrenophora teres f. teres]